MMGNVIYRKSICLCLSLCLVSVLFASCGKKAPKADFSSVSSVCELATLRCYYHNVAKTETEANGALAWLGAGYKKIWTEYSGIVELGIKADKLVVSEPNRDNVVTVTIPDAEILNVDFDTESMSDSITDKGLFTKITGEEKAAALASAQETMKQSAEENEALLLQAKERAKSTIEGYIKNVGEQLGEKYTIAWKDAK